MTDPRASSRSAAPKVASTLFIVLTIVATTFGTVSAQTIDDMEGEPEEGSVNVTELLTCDVPLSSLLGPGTPVSGSFGLTLQLRGDGTGVVNGRHVAPVDIRLNGTSSVAMFRVSQLLTGADYQHIAYLLPYENQRTFEMYGPEIIGWWASGPRFLTVDFAATSITIASHKDGAMTEMAREQCF